MKQTLKKLFSRKKLVDEHFIEGKYFAKYKDLINQESIIRIMDEYKSQRILYEPIRYKLTEKVQDEAFMQIDNSKSLSRQEKFETIIGLMMVLDGSFPEQRILANLQKVFGRKFIDLIEKKKKEFKSEISEKEETKELTILRNKEWGIIKDQWLRVIEFVPMGKIENGKIMAIPRLPYASLRVECKKFSKKVNIFITHKLDFKNLWEAMKERPLNENEEVLITCPSEYSKKTFKLFSPAMPKMVVFIYPKDTYEKFTNPEWWRGEKRTAEPISPIARWMPDVFSLFKIREL